MTKEDRSLKTIIFSLLNVTWNHLVHLYIRLIKLIFKQHNCLPQQVSTFRCEITLSSTWSELSPCFSPVIIICSLPRWLSAITYLSGSPLDSTDSSEASYVMRVKGRTKTETSCCLRQLLKTAVLNTLRSNLVKLKYTLSLMLRFVQKE